MKLLFSAATLLAFSWSLPVIAEPIVMKTLCHQGSCFQNGWTTKTRAGYQLTTTCKYNDCTKFGWVSAANDYSTYDVTCKNGSCFEKGWYSVQTINGQKLLDEVTCKNSGCLRAGWDVKTGYDNMGGQVSCRNGDCSRYGGTAFWRGRPSSTQCFDEQCYQKGWMLTIY